MWLVDGGGDSNEGSLRAGTIGSSPRGGMQMLSGGLDVDLVTKGELDGGGEEDMTLIVFCVSCLVSCW